MMNNVKCIYSVKRYIVIYLFFLFFVTIVSFNFFSMKSKKIVLKKVDQRLTAAANAIRYSLADDFHDRAVDVTSINKTEELINKEQIAKLVNATGISNIYTLVKKGEHFFYSALRVDDDRSSERSRSYFVAFNSSSKQFAEAYKMGEIYKVNHSNQWGNFRTVIVPMKSPSGKSYLACADYPISMLKDRINEYLYCESIPLLLFVVLFIPFPIVAWYLINKCMNAFNQLTQKDDDQKSKNLMHIKEIEARQSQLMLALQTGKRTIFKWMFNQQKIEITHACLESTRRLKHRRLPVSYFKKRIHIDDEAQFTKKLALYIGGASDTFSDDLRMKFGDKYYNYRVVGEIFERSHTGIGLSMVGVAEDITNIKNKEFDMQRNQKLEAIGHLAGGIAHDFNNMLQAIIGYADMIKVSMPAESENSEIIDLLLDAASKSKMLVAQLLTFSRMGKEKNDSINVSQTIEPLIAILNRLMGEDIILIAKYADYIPYISVNKGQFEQALMNICLNARDAMSSGGKITINACEQKISQSFCAANSWAKPGLFAHVSISDNGTGIPEEVVKHVFEPFFTTKEVGKGTGLGLSIVYSIVHKSGGFINLQTSHDKGTTFDLYFPASELMEELKIRSETTSIDDYTGTETVLLAEDTELVRNFTGKSLRKAGYNVLLACDGQEAVEMFQEHKDKVGILVFDIRMPRLNGKLAYEEICKENSKIPVIFCSGYHEEILDTNFYSNFNGSFLPKPYKNSELLKHIRGLLDVAQKQ